MATPRSLAIAILKLGTASNIAAETESATLLDPALHR